LSTDGGNTFPTVLLASTPNDGSEAVPVPNQQSTQARIKVEAIGNVFYDMSDANFTIAAPLRAPFDFDGDAKADYVVTRNTGGTLTWYIRRSTDGVLITQPWGVNTDTAVPGDYDNDGKYDVAIFRAGTFYVLQSSNSTLASYVWGSAGDDARISQDFDGDGKTDPAVTRNVGGTLTYYILKSTGGFSAISFGTAATDTPIRGDFDGDGKADIASYRATANPLNQFRILRSSDNALQTHGFGTPGVDYVVQGDFDGDQKTDFAVWRGKTVAGDGGWYWVRSSNGALGSQAFGLAGTDIPAPGDYDSDGKTDFVVWRTGANGTFYTLGSSAGFSGFNFGIAGDSVPASTLLTR
jgi:hypothetical protein